MLRQGPIPLFVHGVIEYAAGVLFVVAPWLFGFDSSAAKAFSLVIGIVILVVAASTDAPTGLAKTIPIKGHVVLDVVLAIALVAAPFVLGFSDETNPTALFIALGIVHMLLTIATRFLPEKATSA